MKKLFYIVLSLTLCVAACTNAGNSNISTNKKGTIKVGVFDKNGDSPDCIADAMEALRIDKGIDARIISAADIMGGDADDIDVFLFPGGGGRSETSSLGLLGQQKIISLVKQGKGVVGICAGAYILTQTPDYPSLGLSGCSAIDIEHDHRGHGLAKFGLTEEGKKIFPELAKQDTLYCQYYEGPVLVPAKNANYKFTSLATMHSDVHTIEGTPANMTNNRPFLVVSDVEKGRSASIIAHPEATQGMRWMIPRLVRYVAKKDLVSYGNNVVRPDIYKAESLFTTELSKKQGEAMDNLTGQTTEGKLKAMQDIVDMRSWGAKKVMGQMVRDTSAQVRLLAAKLVVELERTDNIPDLKAAVKNEKDPEVKKQLQSQLDLLEKMIQQ